MFFISTQQIVYVKAQFLLNDIGLTLEQPSAINCREPFEIAEHLHNSKLIIIHSFFSVYFNNDFFLGMDIFT